MRFLACILFVATTACSSQQSVLEVQGRDEFIHQLNSNLIKVVSEDNFSPPVASRIYAYCNLAAYEVIQESSSNMSSYASLLDDFPDISIDTKSPIIWEVAMISCYSDIAKHLVYRDNLIESFRDELIGKISGQSFEQSEIRKAQEWGIKYSQQFKKWIDKDGYLQSRNLPRYEKKGRIDSWEPTAPTFGEALEPHWKSLRPFLIDSASQFRSNAHIAFSKEKNSPFYNAAFEIYEIVNKTEQEDINIAVYWDCNPGPTQVQGHLMQLRKQNTPGGHWLGINQIACLQRKLPLLESCAIYARLAMGIADGFIAAWDTKFTYHLIRPETYINRYIDPDWRPKLESPLFPEYTSAHSLISGVAASVLTDAHGDNFQFTDTTNVQFGLPSRKFGSFWKAAKEAASSRILGGIHYQFGCDEGLEQGRKLGATILTKMKKEAI